MKNNGHSKTGNLPAAKLLKQTIRRLDWLQCKNPQRWDCSYKIKGAQVLGDTFKVHKINELIKLKREIWPSCGL